MSQNLQELSKKILFVNENVGVDCIKKALDKHFSTYHPIKFQRELQDTELDTLSSHQQQIVFGDEDGTYFDKIDFALAMSILRLKKENTLLPYFEELYEIHEKICTSSVDTILYEELDKACHRQKYLLEMVGADLDFYWSTSLVTLKRELDQMKEQGLTKGDEDLESEGDQDRTSLKYEDFDVSFQKIYNASRKIGLDRMMVTMSKYFSIDHPIIFQEELKAKSLEALFPDEHATLFKDSNGVDVSNIDFALSIKILRATNDPLLPGFEKLYQIRNETPYGCLKSFGKVDRRNEFDKQKRLLIDVGAKEEDVEYWWSAPIDVLCLEFPIFFKDLLNQLRKSNKSNISFLRKPFADLLLPDSLDIVCELIGDKWRDLYDAFAIDEVFIAAVKVTDITTKEKMSIGFEYLYNRVSWSSLKTQLQKLGREDIIQTITNETFITEGLKELSESLYKHWEECFASDEHVLESFRLENADINLAETKKSDLDENEADLTDYEFQDRFRTTQSIKMKNILMGSENIVLLRGISGIGKTFLLKQMAMRWSKRELLNDINYLYILRCRDLSIIGHTLLIDLVRNNFELLLKNISNVELIDVAKKTAIFIDGFDELLTVDREILSGVINDNIYEFKVFITSRPYPMTALYKKIKGKSPKLVNVLGFTEESMNLFVNKFYEDHPQKSNKIHSFERAVQDNSEMSVLASIPAYLHALCCLNDNIESKDFPDTKTELFLLVALVMVHSKIKDFKLIHCGLLDMCANEVIIKVISLLSKLSYSCLIKGRAIPKNKIGENADILVKSGWLFKSETKKEVSYQFRHFIFEEVLAGLHLALLGKKGNSHFLKNSSHLLKALPSVIALHGMIRHRKENDVIRRLVSCLSYYRAFDFSPSSTSPPFTSFDPLKNWIVIKLEQFVLNSVKDQLHTIGPNLSLLLDFIFEHKAVPPTFQDFFDFINVKIQCHYLVKYIARLFPLLYEKTAIDWLFINMEDGIVTDNEIVMMKDVFWRCKSIELRSQINFELLLKHVERPDVSVINLETLHISSNNIHESSVEYLMKFVPYLKIFEMEVTHIQTESINLLCDSIIQANNNNELILQTLTIRDLSNEKINTLLPCISCIENVYISGLDGSESYVSDSKLKYSTVEQVNCKCRHLELEKCYLTNGNLTMLQDVLKSVEHFEIKDSEQTHEFVSLIKQLMINEQAPQLKSLGFSRLMEVSLTDILTFINHLSELEIFETDISMKWFYKVNEKFTEAVSSLELLLSEATQSNQEEIDELFADTSVQVEFR